MKPSTALFFGRYDPIHKGHLAVAEAALAVEGCKEVWFVVTPVSPAKAQQKAILDASARLDLMRLALANNPCYRALDIELSLPSPQYTATTCQLLREKYPNHSFSLLMGADNLLQFRQWRDSEDLIKHHDLWVYPRKTPSQESITQVPSPSFVRSFFAPDSVRTLQAPRLAISSTKIRQHLAQGQSCEDLLPDAVHQAIQSNNFYAPTPTQNEQRP